jgi:uncharacterized protein YndB with AHSA1/START domain
MEILESGRGNKTRPKKTRSVSHQYFIRASPSRVFEAITESKWLVKWLSDTAVISPRKGGQYSIGWKDGPTHEGDVLDFVPGKSVTLAWSWEGVKLKGTTFKLSVEPKGDGTLFEVEHSGFPREEKWTDLYGGAEWGWTYFAMNLKSLLETGHDLRSSHDG